MDTTASAGLRLGANVPSDSTGAALGTEDTVVCIGASVAALGGSTVGLELGPDVTVGTKLGCDLVILALGKAVGSMLGVAETTPAGASVTFGFVGLAVGKDVPMAPVGVAVGTVRSDGSDGETDSVTYGETDGA